MGAAEAARLPLEAVTVCGRPDGAMLEACNAFAVQKYMADLVEESE
jgi:hypothetical protein